MRIGILLTLIALSATAFAQKKDEPLPLAKLASKVSIPFDPKDVTWLQNGGIVELTILVDKNGKAKIADINGPMAPCDDLQNLSRFSLRKAAVEALEKAAYEAARDDAGNPVAGGLRLTIKVPSHAAKADPAAPAGVPKLIQGGVINGKAVSLEKPAYPREARAAGASGAVSVQVLIDEEGKVVEAGAKAGDPLLRFPSEDAACHSKFSPTLLSGHPVKVSGVITYNYVQ